MRRAVMIREQVERYLALFTISVAVVGFVCGYVAQNGLEYFTRWQYEHVALEMQKTIDDPNVPDNTAKLGIIEGLLKKVPEGH